MLEFGSSAHSLVLHLHTFFTAAALCSLSILNPASIRYFFKHKTFTPAAIFCSVLLDHHAFLNDRHSPPFPLFDNRGPDQQARCGRLSRPTMSSMSPVAWQEVL
jgi:hypothetical protein